MKFRILFICLMLLVTLQSSGQSTYKTGISFGNVPMVIKVSDGTWIVRGDSLTAIKMLWEEIQRHDSVHNIQMNKMFGFISDLKKDRHRMIDGVKNIQKILTVKP